MPNFVTLPRMRNFTLILLAALYFICASGVYVHAHFCGGELSDISYFALHENDSCGCGNEAADTDCCKDILHFYKVDAHQDGNFVKASAVFSIKMIAVKSNIELFFKECFSTKSYAFSSNASPPYLFAKASKYIVNSVFRI